MMMINLFVSLNYISKLKTPLITYAAADVAKWMR